MPEYHSSERDAAFKAMVDASAEAARKELGEQAIESGNQPLDPKDFGPRDENDRMWMNILAVDSPSDEKVTAPAENLAPNEAALTDQERHDAEYMLDSIIDSITTDAAKAAAIKSRRLPLALSLMGDRTLKPVEMADKLKWAIREDERRRVAANRGDHNEYQLHHNTPESVRARQYRDLAAMEDERKRGIAALGLVAEIAAAEMKLDRADPRVEEVARELKPLIDQWLSLPNSLAENVVLSLQQAVKMTMAKRVSSRDENHRAA